MYPYTSISIIFKMSWDAFLTPSSSSSPSFLSNDLMSNQLGISHPRLIVTGASGLYIKLTIHEIYYFINQTYVNLRRRTDKFSMRWFNICNFTRPSMSVKKSHNMIGWNYNYIYCYFTQYHQVHEGKISIIKHSITKRKYNLYAICNFTVAVCLTAAGMITGGINDIIVLENIKF